MESGQNWLRLYPMAAFCMNDNEISGSGTKILLQSVTESNNVKALRIPKKLKFVFTKKKISHVS
jgi:hypothetical protein